MTEQRDRQTAYFAAKPGVLDMDRPPAQLYREVLVDDPHPYGFGSQARHVRLRAVANLLTIDPSGRSPQAIRFFTWELC